MEKRGQETTPLNCDFHYPLGRNPEHTAAVPRKGPQERGIPIRFGKGHLGLQPKAFLSLKAHL